MEKIDFKKKYKKIYGPSKKTPSIIEVPRFNYACISGEGNPGTSKTFNDAIGALYSLSYTISMSYKGDFKIKGFHPYVVAPLEGVWDIIDGIAFHKENKDNLKWTIAIMQPDFVTDEIFNQAINLAYLKKKNEDLKNIKFVEYNDGLCCTFMHIGSYDNEDQSFEIMGRFIIENGYERIEKTHREIYLSDFRKTAPEKLRTVLRVKIK